MVGAGAGLTDSKGVFILITHWLLYLLALAGSSPRGIRLINGAIGAFRSRAAQLTVGAVIFIGMFLISVAFLVTDGSDPFLYFRF